MNRKDMFVPVRDRFPTWPWKAAEAWKRLKAVNSLTMEEVTALPVFLNIAFGGITNPLPPTDHRQESCSSDLDVSLWPKLA